MASADPDEDLMERAEERRDPAIMGDSLRAIETNLHYELPKIKWALRLIVIILVFIAWRLW